MYTHNGLINLGTLCVKIRMQSSFTKKPVQVLGESGSNEYDNPAGLRNLNFLGSPGGITWPMPLTPLWSRRLADVSQSRILPHLSMAALALAAIILSQSGMAWGSIRTIQPLKQSSDQAGEVAPLQDVILPLTLSGQLNNTQNGVFVQIPVPRTLVANRGVGPTIAPDQISTYVVQPGDTISGIAAKFGLNPETLVWSNPALEKNPDFLSIGLELTVLPLNGIYHQVGSGDTLESIATTFKADVQAMIDLPLNNLDPENPSLKVGEWLVVPGGIKPFVPRTVTAFSGPAPIDASVGSGLFDWPATGSVSQGYFNYHPAIDIAGWTGAPISAADAGYVIVAGWDNMYGYHIVIDHGNGYQTMYAHLSAYYVDVGQNVFSGQQIGEMGSTGNSTGPHLHFEVRQGTVQRNPYSFLR